MANTNLDSTSMTSKVLSLIVAIVVFACVLVPVVGSMTNGGGNGDSGSGGSGTTTYTNTGDYYYKEMDSNDHTLRMTIVADMNLPIGNLTVTYDGESVLTQSIDMSSQEPMSLAPFLIGVWDYGDGRGGPTAYLSFNSGDGLSWVTANGTALKYHPITITHQEEGGGVLTLWEEFSIHEGITHWVSQEVEGATSATVRYALAPSGEYVLAQNPKVDNDSVIYVPEYPFSIDNDGGESVGLISFASVFDTKILTEDAKMIPMAVWDNTGSSENQYISVAHTTESNGVRTISNITISCNILMPDREGEWTYTGTFTISKMIVPVTVEIVDTEYNTYTNVGDYHYKSAIADNREHIVELSAMVEWEEGSSSSDSVTITTDVTIDGVNVYSHSATESELMIQPYVLFGWYGQNPLLLNQYNSCMTYVDYAHPTTDTVLNGTLISEEDEDTHHSLVTQYTISNGLISYSDSGDTHSVPIECYIAPSGEFVSAESPIVGSNTSNPIGIFVIDTAYTESDTYARYCVSTWIYSSEINADAQSVIMPNPWIGPSNPTNVNMSTVVNSTLNDTRRTLESTAIEVSFSERLGSITYNYTDSVTDTHFIVPVSVSIPVESSGGGSESDSGFSGVTSTLIGMIPIFVVLGLLVFAVSKLGLLDMVKSRLE